LALPLVECLDEARLADGGVDGGVSNVGVAGEFADDGGVRAGVRETGADLVT